MKRLILISMILSAMTMLVGIVSAQDDTKRDGVRGGIIREVLQVASEETGLSIRDIMSQMQPDGATLADVIEANGGSVDAVITTSIANVTDRANQAVADGDATQEQVDQLLSNLEQLITDGINGDLPRGDNGSPRRNMARMLVTTIADETGMDARDVVQATRDGATPAEVIEANGGSVDNVIASATVTVTDRVNEAVANGNMTQEQADNILGNIEQTLTDILNGEFERPRGGNERPRDGRRPVLGVLRQIAEQTGLTMQEIIPQLRDGATPAEILSENGVDVNVFIDDIIIGIQERLTEAVENGRITQEQADERLESIRTTLTERLNSPVNRDGMSPESDA
jgi:hypothetical protein